MHLHPALSVCIPTKNIRPHRYQTISSALEQLMPYDQLIVDLAPGAWGYPSRDRMCQQAQGDFLMFMDDDDEYLSGAFQIVRDRIGEDRECLHIFRGNWTDRSPLWAVPEVKEDNVSTQLIAVPRDLARATAWGTRYAGDFDFIKAVSEKTETRWHEDLICTVDPAGPFR